MLALRHRLNNITVVEKRKPLKNDQSVRFYLVHSAVCRRPANACLDRVDTQTDEDLPRLFWRTYMVLPDLTEITLSLWYLYYTLLSNYQI